MSANRVTFIMATRKAEGPNIARIIGMLPRGCEFIVSTVPGGAAHARNVAAQKATGNILVFFDDDVQWTTDWNWDEWDRRVWDFAVAEWYSPGPMSGPFSARGPWMRMGCAALNILNRVLHYNLTMSGFTAMRRNVFFAVGGYATDTTFEEPNLTMRLRRSGYRGTRLPVRVTMLQRWDSFTRHNDTTSRDKRHPEPRPGEVQVLVI